MQVRKAKIADLDQLILLHKTYLPSITSFCSDQFLKSIYRLFILQPNNHLCLVASYKELIIGLIVISYNTTKSQKIVSKKASTIDYLLLCKAILNQGLSFKHVLVRPIIQLWLRELKQPVCSLAIICVNPSYQKQGVATKLYTKVINYCHKKQISTIYVESRIDVKPALKFYLKLGFVKRKIFSDAIIFSKKIR